ncbi:hypothetical protein [Marinicrinis sediminis]|uniref:Uncharacterized protein n=1 Tax=Marinicrinis sediminis TaxID=1652465 RepID=A0ABW5R976_9BACL
MDITMMIISLISMIATVISCVVAVKAKNEVKRISLMVNTGQVHESKVDNKGDIEISNTGQNTGVMAGITTGGIKNNAK